MKLSGANASSVALPSDKLPGVVNYFVGRDSRKWRTGIPTYGKVQYLDVYSGIDLVYHSSQNQLEYDFVVNPGADPKKIAFSFEGASALAMSASGDMNLDSPAGKLTAHKPQIYQLQNGQRKPVIGNFVTRDAHTIGVDVKDYDRTQPLVIDPVLTFATYLGGSSDDVATSIATDSQGYSYSTGTTASVDFPVVGTSLSAAPTTNTVGFVSKLDPTGSTLIYSTYLGGTTYDSPNGIAVDANGQAYISGQTSSADFPVTSNAYQTTYGSGAIFNAFLAKLSPDGQSLLYSTFLGGSVNDEGTQVAIDANQNAFVTGYASSPTFPVTAANAFQASLNSVNGNAFVTRIDTTKSGANSLVYSTFLGGSSPYTFNDLNSGNFGGDGALGIAVDANENAYVVGQASSVDFPITAAAAYQTTGNANNSVFLTRLDTNQSGANSLVYSTFLGGTGTSGDLGFAIAIDSSANAYITGCALSSDFPVSVAGTNSAAGKAFVAKFNTNLSGSSSLNYSTFLGGSGGDCALALAVDPDGDAYVGGFTYSSDFPVTANAIQSSFQGNGTAGGFIATLSPDGATLLYGTYIGGNAPSLTSANGVVGLALDSHEDLYIAGGTSSADFATTPGALQTAASGSADGFVAQISGIISTPQISSVSPQSAGIGATVTLIGSAFGNSQGQSTVTFNGAAATPLSWSNTQIIAVVPNGATTGQILVRTIGTSNGANFVVLTPPIISGITPTSGTTGTQVTISGSGFGTTQGIGRILLGTLSGAISSWSDTQIVASVSQSSVSGFAQVFQNGIASNQLNFSVSAPAVTSVLPASGPAGTQVTITGSGFGTTQGSGKVMLGTAYGSVQSWSDTQIVAAVSCGSTSGTAQVSQGGVWSNSTNFTVNVPAIMSITPTSGGASTLVTITGSNFGTSQNSGQVWLGATYGTVTSWGDTQIVATVATGSHSGKVQVLQYGAWSNSVSFSDGTPQITGVNPALGVPGTQVTISGSNFGANQGSGTIWLGSVLGTVLSWTDTHIVSIVASQAATGIARVSQNGSASNSVRFVVPTVGSGNNATLTPSVMNMLVGETRNIQALDSQSHAITGLAWATSDSTIVSLSTDDPPVLSALTAGHVTITAGDSSADVNVSSGSALASGTIVWSNSGDGSGIVQAVPAVPSPTGVADVFALQTSGIVNAVRTDGTMAWTANAGQGNSLLPDFQGGLIVSASDSIKRFDGITGQQVFAHTFANPPSLPGPLHQGKHPVAVHPDGTIFAVDGDSIVGLDGQTGAVKFSVPIEDSRYSSSSQCAPQNNGSSTSSPFVGPTIIAGDGYFYMPYEFLESQIVATYADGTGTPPLCNSQENDAAHLRLIRVGTDGSVQKINFGDWTGYDFSDLNTNTRANNPIPNPNFESLMTNADKGVLFTWSLTYPEACSQFGSDESCFPSTWDIKVTDTSTGATTSTGHLLPAPVLQAQDGTFIGNAINTDDWTTINLAGFNSDGSVKWIGPADAQALRATPDGGGLVVTDSGQYMTFDQTGGVNGQVANAPILSWIGNAYQTNSGSLDAVVSPDVAFASTFAAIRGPSSLITLGFLENGLDQTPSGNASGNGTAVQQEWFPQLQSCLGAQVPCPRESVWDALKALRIKLSTPCPPCNTAVFNIIGGTQQDFSTYLNRQPRFFDGTRSNAPLSVLCSGFLGTLNCTIPASNGAKTISELFSRNPTAGAFSQTPTESGMGMLVFFDPAAIRPAAAATANGILNQAQNFHEALHGKYGAQDSLLLSYFGYNFTDPSCKITDYLQLKIWGGTLDPCN